MSKSSNDRLWIEPVGYIQSPYDEKFAVPRQSGLAPDARSTIHFYPPYDSDQAFDGIEGFSHLHVIFLFDRIEYSSFRPRVRPPRLGGNTYVGVFATRSPFRPNRLGLSIVKLEKVIKEHGRVKLEVSGADLVNGTPIIDIKPYIPFVDALPDARGGFAVEVPPSYEVIYSTDASDALKVLTENQRRALTQILSQDPRPAYKADSGDSKVYSARLYGHMVKFMVDNGRINVLTAEKFEESNETAL